MVCASMLCSASPSSCTSRVGRCLVLLGSFAEALALPRGVCVGEVAGAAMLLLMGKASIARGWGLLQGFEYVRPSEEAPKRNSLLLNHLLSMPFTTEVLWWLALRCVHRHLF